MQNLTHQNIVVMFLSLSALLGMARLLAELAQKLRQPAVLGELLAGVLLRTDELLNAIELAMLLLNEELNADELPGRELELTAALLGAELRVLARAPATRHSRMPVDCVALIMVTRKRLVIIPFSATALNLSLMTGT